MPRARETRTAPNFRTAGRRAAADSWPRPRPASSRPRPRCRACPRRRPRPRARRSTRASTGCRRGRIAKRIRGSTRSRASWRCPGHRRFDEALAVVAAQYDALLAHAAPDGALPETLERRCRQPVPRRVDVLAQALRIGVPAARASAAAARRADPARAARAAAREAGAALRRRRLRDAIGRHAGQRLGRDVRRPGARARDAAAGTRRVVARRPAARVMGAVAHATALRGRSPAR